MRTLPTSASKVEPSATSTNINHPLTEKSTQKLNAKRRLEQAASHENGAEPYSSSGCEIHFVQGVIACLSTGLDDLSEEVLLRLQSTRIAAVLHRRR